MYPARECSAVYTSPINWQRLQANTVPVSGGQEGVPTHADGDGRYPDPVAVQTGRHKAVQGLDVVEEPGQAP